MATKYCSRHGHRVPQTMLICPECGDTTFSPGPAPSRSPAPTPTSGSTKKYCRRHGHELPAAMLICPQCGDTDFTPTPLPLPVTSAPPRQPAQPAPASPPARKYCRAQGHEVPQTALICPRCGDTNFTATPVATIPAPTTAMVQAATQSATKYCRRNGHQVPQAMQICPQCGDTTFSPTRVVVTRAGTTGPVVSAGVPPPGATKTRTTAPAYGFRWLALGWFLVLNAVAWIAGTFFYLVSGAADGLLAPIAWIIANIAALYVVVAAAVGAGWARRSLLAVIGAWLLVAAGLAVWLALPPTLRAPAIYAGVLALVYALACVHCYVAAPPSAIAARDHPTLGDLRTLAAGVGAPLVKPSGKVRSVVLGICAVGLIAFGVVSWMLTQELWWEASIGRGLERQIARAADDPKSVIPSVRALLARNPDNARLYYLLAGLYADARNPLSAHLVKNAYDAVLASHPLQASVEKAWDRVTALDGATSDVTLGTLRQRALANRTTIIDLFAAGAPGTFRVVNAYSVGDVLRQTASAHARGGVLDLDVAEKSGVACIDADRCKTAFASASLRAAAISGTATVQAPQAGANCCTLSLDDADLRPFDLAVVQKSVAATPEIVPGLLNVSSRVVVKQLYMLDFIANTR
ncbi:MAG TPA: hypothetical protein VKX28_23685 [Xanthobacteraceae bacterium]|nr:hypothetical protein [Xanthobacteraceae bacterium]